MSGCSQRVVALALSLLAPCRSPGCADEDMGRRGSAASLRCLLSGRGRIVSRGGSSSLDSALAACCQIKIKVSGRLSGNSCSGAPVLGQ
jgi:hypothetical protein